ncbi:ATP-binding cassette subfamily C protein LapB [Ochrobactrum daejeonense]|uniref:ATP-binding cassette subfamily C protein LapB n=1 Tax=Brucella daejeonensis TaxID=659015 RepID=A0A7W9AUT4_9HYPH|nr:type I secretion system permease/ATPase [Brucella daejeonensis]MBB5700973.1 ATP-binding cassette subfamily C protein LapB [Brucella daejeonensis]
MADTGTASRQSWVAAIVALAGLKGIVLTEAEFAHQGGWAAPGRDPIETLRDIASRSGLRLDLLNATLDNVPDMLLPAIFEIDGGRTVLVLQRGTDSVRLTLPGLSGRPPIDLPLDEFNRRATGRVLLVEPMSTRNRDARIEAFLQKPTHHWLRELVLKDRRGYRDVALASVFSNLLTFASALFAMQLWDRVIPARSIPTLWVLGLGTAMALLLDLLLRTARVVVLDRMGKQADLAISARIFARALDIRNDDRPKSTGAFIAQIRDIEQIRDLMTSTTVSALVDLPFVLLFLAFFALIAGQLTFVLIAAMVLIAIPGLLIQFPLARLAREGTRESALRHAILVESIERIEEIKASQAEPRFQSLWERFTYLSARISAKQRFYSALFTNWTQSLQQLTYTAVLIAGAYLVMDGDMSTGALVACSIMTSRALVLFVPFGQIFTRWQSARLAMGALTDLMQKPVDHDPQAGLLRRNTLRGDYRIEQLSYAYEPDGPAALRIENLVIQPGERVALLGHIGAGKSTLLRLLAGMARPDSGKLLLDDSSLSMISPADVRREIGYLGQSAQLFLGTIRENILIGAPHASDEDILKALAITGGLPLVQGQSHGLDLMLQEGGIGLSGGQRQTLLLARTLLRAGNILLLDEPSAPLDERSEQQLVQSLSRWLDNRTLIVTTNRSGLLPLVNRIVVINKGRVTMDGPRDKVIAALTGKPTVATVNGTVRRA